MKRRPILAIAGVAIVALAGNSHAAFKPKFDLKLSTTKINANPNFQIHLEFAGTDDEIGLFTMKIPAGYKLASDKDIPDKPAPLGGKAGEVLGGGTIRIQAGPGCHSMAAGTPASALATQIPVDASIHERAVTSEEAKAGAKAVWVLDIEPLNRVRLLVKGSPAAGWTISGAPTPSEATCNPLVVDLTINGKSESGKPLITNPATVGKRTFTAEITNQANTAKAKFSKAFTFTR